MSEDQNPKDASKGKFPGFYPGRVVNNNDPEKSGRLQIRFEQVTGDPAADDGEIQDEQLPWAFPCFPVTGVNTGEYHVPPVGAQVWVSWFGGSPEYPIWFGGTVPTAELPSEFSSSYEGTEGPKTRLVKNDGDQVFEMRWKTKEEAIKLKTALEVALCLIDADALGGPKVDLGTKGGFKLTLDEKLKLAKIATAAGFLLEANETTGLINIATPAGYQLLLNEKTANVVLKSLGTMTISAVAGALSILAIALTLTATGVLSITGLGLALLTTGAAVTIGAAGTFQGLATAQHVNTTYATHVHPGVTAGPSSTGPPVPLPVAGDITTNTLAN